MIGVARREIPDSKNGLEQFKLPTIIGDFKPYDYSKSASHLLDTMVEAFKEVVNGLCEQAHAGNCAKMKRE